MAKKEKDSEEKEDRSDGTVAVNDAWTGMLAISLLALGIATGILAWDYNKYADADIPKAPLIGSAPKVSAPKAVDPVKIDPAKDKDKDKDKDGGADQKKAL